MTEQIDWDRFHRIVQRHRVAGLVNNGLAQAGISVPPDFASKIQKMADEIVRQNLQFTAEALRIQRSFDKADVPIVFVKGVSLAQLAYGSLALKQSWDIDLLVSPDTVSVALQLLAQAGYHAFPPLPPVTDVRYQRWMKYARECVLFHESNSVHVEIHWRLADNSDLLPGVTARSPTRMVPISSEVAIRTLLDDDLFAYLCVHGALHGWSRLKWLADVAAMMAQDTAADAKRRLAAARMVNAENCVAQTYLLCNRLFGTPSVTALSQTLRLSYCHRWLERVALRTLMSGNAETELGNAAFDRLLVTVSHFFLGRGWHFKAKELSIKLNGPYDMQYTTLPYWLRFLYPLFRVTSFLQRQGRLRPLRVPPKASQE